MAPLKQLYDATDAQLLEWVCRTYGIVVENTGSSILQAPVSNAAFTKSNVAVMNPHRVRREAIAVRLRLYRDDAVVDANQLIDQTYNSTKYQMELKKYVKLALGQNISRRIVDEVASLYDQPAKRELKDDAEQTKFRAEEKRLHLHELLQENQRLLTLCNETMMWRYDGADGLPRLRIVTSNMFDAIPDPRDPLVHAGILIDRETPTIFEGDKRKNLPHWDLWDDTYRYPINAYGRLVTDKGDPASEPIAHGLGRIPGVLLHRREPTFRLLDASHGADIVSAHLAVVLLNMLIMRLAKVQGEKQPVIQGNLAALADGQVMDGENPLKLPPETKATMLAMATDPEHYIKAKRDVMASIAQSYGLSYEQLTISESAKETSGKSYEVRRMKLNEIRAEAKRRASINERLIVDLMGFDTEGMKIDHREPTLPQDPVAEIVLLADKSRMGLDSPIAYLQRQDTDLHREDAIALMQKNLGDFALQVALVRALNIPGSGVGQSPQANGAMRAGDHSMDNTRGGGPINPITGAKGDPQAQLRLRSDEVSQIVPSGLSAVNPVDDFANGAPSRTPGADGRQG